jgi:hypothetical protein
LPAAPGAATGIASGEGRDAVASDDLTGVWDGTFTYPSRYGATQFTAVLLDLGGSLSGTVHEIATSKAAAGQSVRATLAGRRTGSRVSFTKLYDAGTPGHRKPVHYDGVLSADRDQIDGEWRIIGNWSGQFLMVRSRGRGAEADVEARDAVPVD